MLKHRGNTKQWLLDKHRKALHCLENKLFGRPLPSSFDEGILLDDLFSHRPEELPGVSDIGERRLYFTRPSWVNGRKRSSEFGRWHACDGKQEIRDLEDRPLGFAQHLIYFLGGCVGIRTKWAMTEYTLASSRIPPGVDELSLSVIYKTRDYKRNQKTSCGKNPKAKMMDDAGPSDSPSELVSQAENKVREPTDLPFPDGVASMEFPMDHIMDWVNDPWFKYYLGGISSGFDNLEWTL